MEAIIVNVCRNCLKSAPAFLALLLALCLDRANSEIEDQRSPNSEIVDPISTVSFSSNSRPSLPINEEEATNEGFYVEKTKNLLEMGFKDSEISYAMDIFGPEVSISELADSIFANRIARELDYDKKEDGHEHRSKKAKQMLVDANEASFSSNISKEELHTQHTSTNAWIAEAGMPNLLNHPIPIEEEAPIPHSINITPPLSRPPFLFYGSFIDVPLATWKKLSQFLNNIEPEFVNTRFFSAIIRKEGYFHNLPEGNRARIFPESPMTVEEALPHTRRWWPPWDSRKQFSFTSSDSLSAEILCKDLGEMLRTSQGMPSKEQQNRILLDCSMMNLVWIGENKLGPVAPNEMECILGYPNQHTEVFGMELDDRMRVLKDCFQINTLAYHLSTLRNMFPEGVRLLSVYSGIGGAEIALHRLGIHLKCVVSVETDERNHEILKRWWQCTEQTGELLQIEGVKNVTTNKLSGIINNLGGIDIIVGRTLPASKNVSRVRRSDSIDMSAFFEFARVFQQVKCITKGV